MSDHVDEGTSDQSPHANSRFNPGAIFIPIIAASMGMVPEPQKGSMSNLSGCQTLKSTNAAANVSLIGASAFSVRYPRLWILIPVVSSVMV